MRQACTGTARARDVHKTHSGRVTYLWLTMDSGGGRAACACFRSNRRTIGSDSCAQATARGDRPRKSGTSVLIDGYSSSRRRRGRCCRCTTTCTGSAITGRVMR